MTPPEPVTAWAHILSHAGIPASPMFPLPSVDQVAPALGFDLFRGEHYACIDMEPTAPPRVVQPILWIRDAPQIQFSLLFQLAAPGVRFVVARRGESRRQTLATQRAVFWPVGLSSLSSAHATVFSVDLAMVCFAVTLPAERAKKCPCHSRAS